MATKRAKKVKNWETGPGVKNDEDIVLLKSETRILLARIKMMEESYMRMFRVFIDMIPDPQDNSTNKLKKTGKGK